MAIDWKYYLIAGTAEIIVVWLLWPTRTYRIAREWLQCAERARFKHWIHYRSIKREVTPDFIAMHAVKSPTFTLDDLNALNDLFKLLDNQPLARAIVPEVGCRFERSTMTDLADDSVAGQAHDYVLEVRSIGVEWGDLIRRRAEVIGCTADRLLIFKLNEVRNVEIAQRFVAFLQQERPITTDFQLHRSRLQGFIDEKCSESEIEEFFKLLINLTPTTDISLVMPKVADPYNNDTMTYQKGQPGQVCKVAKVIYPGLTRKHDKNWRIKALVEISNISLL